MSKATPDAQSIIKNVTDLEKYFIDNMMSAYDVVREADITAGGTITAPSGYIPYKTHHAIVKPKTVRNKAATTLAAAAAATKVAPKMPNKFTLDVQARSCLFAIAQSLIMMSIRYYKHVVKNSLPSTVSTYDTVIMSDVPDIQPILRLSMIIPSNSYSLYDGREDHEFLTWIKIQINAVANDIKNLPLDGPVIHNLAKHNMAVYNYLAYHLTVCKYNVNTKVTHHDFWITLLNLKVWSDALPPAAAFCSSQYITQLRDNIDYISYYNLYKTIKASKSPRKSPIKKLPSTAIQEPVEPEVDNVINGIALANIDDDDAIQEVDE